MTIAQRFNAGQTDQSDLVPEGRLNRSIRSNLQPSLRDSWGESLVPSVKTLG